MTLEAMKYFEYKGRHLRMSANISILNTFRYDAYWVFSWYFFWKQENAKIFQNVPYNLPNTNFRHFRNISFHWFNEPTLTRQILKLKIHRDHPVDSQFESIMFSQNYYACQNAELFEKQPLWWPRSVRQPRKCKMQLWPFSATHNLKCHFCLI